MKHLATDVSLQPDPVESARDAGLRYVSDGKPGIRRIKCGKNFSYVGSDGKRITGHNEVLRIKRLAIPPAWTDVWICPLENGHLQATGRDARGRKQYRYHSKWRETRDETKYERMLSFGRELPRIRRRVKRDLALPGMPREKVLATVVRLLETTLIRVGNEEYARNNKSFGLTTLRDRHVDVSATKVRFHFRGKSGKDHAIDVSDPKLARILKRCRDIPGQELFQYIEGSGETKTIDSADVNAYLQEVCDRDCTAKDFRTWAGTLLAAAALKEFERFESQAEAKRNIVKAIEAVSKTLGNTPSICRKCYIHPQVLNSYLDGTLVETLHQRAAAKIAHGLGRLKPEEAAVLMFLEQRLKAEAKKGSASRKRPRVRMRGLSD